MILVTGAAGNVGSAVVKKLLKKDRNVRCLLRETSSRTLLQGLDIEIAVGDLRDRDSVFAACEGVEAVVSVAYISLTQHLLEAIAHFNIPRVVFLGSTGIYTKLPSNSAQAKRDLEAVIIRGDTNYTILRPTMIYGNQRDRNIFRLLRFLKKSPVAPVFARGRSQTQPVHIDDVVSALVSALETPGTIGKAYDIGGASVLPYRELLKTAAHALGRKVFCLPLPLGPAKAAVTVLRKLVPRFNIRTEQVARLVEDKNVDISPARQDFGYNPITFEEGVTRQVALCRKKGLL